MRYLELSKPAKTNADEEINDIFDLADEEEESEGFGTNLDEVKIDELLYGRLSSGMAWLDPVLGECFQYGESGVARKSVYLLSGSKGAGKSSLMRLMMNHLAKDDENLVFWASNEERMEVIKLQNKRLGIVNSKVLYDNIRDVDAIIRKANRSIAAHKGAGKEVYPILLIDSLQGLVTVEYDKKKKETTETQNVEKIVSKLVNWSHMSGATIFIIGHETTSGAIKGGSNIQHIVDAVLRVGFDKKNECRYILAEKNRNGGIVQEKVHFAMSSRGIDSVTVD